MSAYDNDPRVVRSASGYRFSVDTPDGSRMVLQSQLIGGGWDAYEFVDSDGRRYPETGIPGTNARTADEAIRSLIGDPA